MMAYRQWISGIWVLVLCQFGTLAACSGNGTDETSGDPGGGTGGADSGSGDGDSSGSGGSQGGTVPPPQVSCERSGIVEFCGPGEGCCNCGCGVVTDSCTREVACPAHEGPTCGLSQCREGTICCDADAGHCAESAANCPE